MLGKNASDIHYLLLQMGEKEKGNYLSNSFKTLFCRNTRLQCVSQWQFQRNNKRSIQSHLLISIQLFLNHLQGKKKKKHLSHNNPYALGMLPTQIMRTLQTIWGKGFSLECIFQHGKKKKRQRHKPDLLNRKDFT